MKKLIFFVMAAGIVACSPPDPKVTISNPGEIPLTEKAVVLSRADVMRSLKNIPEGQVVLLSPDGGKTFIPSQMDDMDNDGKWDELFTLVDLAPGESKTFNLVLKDASEAPQFQKRTNIHFSERGNPEQYLLMVSRLKSSDTETSQKSFQYEGPGWENDVVGFRNYFDARNGMDIWGKTTSEMVLQQVGLVDGPSYHELQPWGMDILKVANSLGAGAIALQTADTLYRIGPDGDNLFHLVTQGPLRSALDLQFNSVPFQGKNLDINHRIIIIAGKPWYQSEVTVTGAEKTKLVSGIVNLETESVAYGNGPGYSYLFTHDNQAYDGEKLGMAIISPYESMEVLTAPEEGPGITQTFYTTFEITKKPVVFLFMAGWEKQDPRWADPVSFEAGVKEQGQAAFSKPKVTFSR